jgi:adenosylhomocysteine nucleosidase
MNCIADPCVLVAMDRESQGLRQDFPRRQRFIGAPVSAWFCGPSGRSILVVETGIGPDAVRKALDWVFSKPRIEQSSYEPKLLLYAGFAGALTPELHLGDLILATEVANMDGNRWRTTWPGEPAAGQLPLRRGTILSAPRIIADPQEKSRLSQAHQALAVDMESATFASMCSRNEIPFGCLRAVSDDCATSLSTNLVKLLSGSRVSPWRVIATSLIHPSLIKELMRLARETRLAGNQLGKAIGELLAPKH